MPTFPLGEWFTDNDQNGLCIVEFPVHIDYEVLYKVLETLENKNVVLIHSKPIEINLWKSVLPVDATLHSRTVDSRMRHRVTEDSILRLNPFSTQTFMVSLRRQVENASKELEQPLWWLWWTPSDLAIQRVDDETIVECIGAIGSEYMNTNFIVFVAKEAHTERGLSLLELTPRILIDVEYQRDENRYRWQVVRHPNRELRGETFEYKM